MFYVTKAEAAHIDAQLPTSYKEVARKATLTMEASDLSNLLTQASLFNSDEYAKRKAEEKAFYASITRETDPDFITSQQRKFSQSRDHYRKSMAIISLIEAEREALRTGREFNRAKALERAILDDIELDRINILYGLSVLGAFLEKGDWMEPQQMEMF